MFDDSRFNDFEDDEYDDDEWDEEQWEEFFQQEDEQKRRLQELLDKYGFTEEGLRKAFEEMGYYIPEEDDDDFDDIDSLDELDNDIDNIIEQEYGDQWESEISEQSHLQNAHPLFRSCYYLVLKIMKSLRHIRVKYRDHPIIIFQTGLFECMSKLIRAGYDDIDSKLEAEQGLILAALKRARQALLLSLLTIPRLDALKIFSDTTLTLYRNEITELLKQINQEIILNKTEK
ncbi:MAG: hypothetical protein JSW07_14550 [bacterium]|nr:MAG: hypothetical protein JSW07_14550 [bacterium]